MTDRTDERAGAAAWLSFLCRVLVAGIFGYAAYLKISDPQQFVYAVKAFRTGLPDGVVLYSAFAAPWCEMIFAVALLLGFWPRAAGIATGAMLVLFIVLIWRALSLKLDMATCGCFGKHGLPPCGPAPSWCHIAQNAVMLGMCGLIAATRRHVLAVRA